MKNTGEWGEFFPSTLSHFAYNETFAQQYYPLIKEEAESRGFQWQEKFQFTVGQETMESKDIPESIHNVADTIVSEVLACRRCRRNYRILPAELTFYRSMVIPIPRQCFFCRHDARVQFKTPPFQVFGRTCTCGGVASNNGAYKNQTTHFHQDKPCPNEFETSYSPERKEIIYCKDCYQSEIF